MSRSSAPHFTRALMGASNSSLALAVKTLAKQDSTLREGKGRLASARRERAFSAGEEMARASVEVTVVSTFSNRPRVVV